jgi:large subunit ribosomal protein L9
MKLILRDDVKSLGRAGDLVSVSEGYARNFLLPKKLAVPATPENQQRREQEVNGKKFREKRAHRDSEYLAEKLSAKPLVLTVQTGEGGKLFGSVTTSDIEQALAAAGLEVDKRKIELEEPIKMVGSYVVSIKLPHEVTAKVTVVVEPKPAPGEPKVAKAEGEPKAARSGAADAPASAPAAPAEDETAAAETAEDGPQAPTA